MEVKTERSCAEDERGSALWDVKIRFSLVFVFHKKRLLTLVKLAVESTSEIHSGYLTSETDSAPQSVIQNPSKTTFD